MAVQNRRRWRSVRGRVERGEKRREAVRIEVKFGGGARLLLGSWERWGWVAGGGGGVNIGINGFNAIEDGGGFKRGIKGGEMKARW
jgi:hypothetical protein